jgi:hypothetical protein
MNFWEKLWTAAFIVAVFISLAMLGGAAFDAYSGTP